MADSIQSEIAVDFDIGVNSKCFYSVVDNNILFLVIQKAFVDIFYLLPYDIKF